MNGARGTVIAVTAAFVVGISVGLIGGILLMRFTMLPGPRFGPPWMEARRPGMPGGPGGPEFVPGPGGPRGRGRFAPGVLLPGFESALDLTPAQRARIDAELGRARLDWEARRESTRAVIESTLTEKQRAQWRAMEERYRRAWQGRFGLRGRR